MSQSFQPGHCDSRLTIERIQIRPHAHVDESTRLCRLVNLNYDLFEEGVDVRLEVGQSLSLERLLPHTATAGVLLEIQNATKGPPFQIRAPTCNRLP
jgi:hypothetical protein